MMAPSVYYRRRKAFDVMAAREQGITVVATCPSVESFLGAWSQSCVCVLTVLQGRVKPGIFVVINLFEQSCKQYRIFFLGMVGVGRVLVCDIRTRGPLSRVASYVSAHD